MSSRHSNRVKLAAVAVVVVSLAPGVASGQAFQVFGIGDAAVSGQSNRSNSAGQPGTMSTLSSGAWQSSRLGLRGKVPVTDETSAVYDAATTLGLNSGTILNYGSVSGSTPTFNAFRIFDRNIYGGVSNETFGTLTAGRQATGLAEALWVTDPLKANAGATNMNVRLAYLAGPSSALNAKFGPNPSNNINGNALDRQDNAFKYVYKNSGFVGLGMYSFGGTAGDRQKNSSSSAMLGYDHPFFSVRAAAGQFYDANAIGLYAWTAGATANLGPLKLKGTYSANFVNDTATYGNMRTAIWSGGVTYSATPKLDLTLAYYGARRTQDAVPTQKAGKLYFVPEWYVTKSFWIYGIVDYEAFNDHGAALDTGTPLPAGTRNSFYLALGVSFSFSS